jgi:hypothetical protein
MRKLLLALNFVRILSPLQAKATGICLYPIQSGRKEISAHAGRLISQNSKKKRRMMIRYGVISGRNPWIHHEAGLIMGESEANRNTNPNKLLMEIINVLEVLLSQCLAITKSTKNYGFI